MDDQANPIVFAEAIRQPGLADRAAYLAAA